MINLKSVKNFFIVNTVVSIIGTAKRVVVGLLNDSLFGFILSDIASSIALLTFTDVDKPYIHQPKLPIVTKNKYEPYTYLIITSALKGITHFVLCNINININNTLITSTSSTTLSADFGYFILKSFIIEIVFDGCHYFIHRACHQNKWLYKNIHKTHHTHVHTEAISTFYMEPTELILVYSIPLTVSLLTTSYLISPLNNYEFYLLTVYLTLQEIGGHTGKQMYPTSSFSQCIWIPRMLDIQLYTEDHDLHHTHRKYNFSKRFNLFDKIFGTYKKAITVK